MADEQASKPASRPIPEAARRALKEAEERRAAVASVEQVKEIGGRKGLEPVRYGDWELNGIAQDF